MMRKTADARGRNNSMTRDCKRQPVIAACLTDGTRFAIDAARELAIRCGGAWRDTGDLFPHPALKIGAFDRQR